MGHPGLKASPNDLPPILAWSEPRGSLGIGGRWGPFGQEDGWSWVTRSVPFTPGCLICGAEPARTILEKRLLCAGRASCAGF